MPSTISAGTTAGTAIAIAGDTTGNLAFQTNGTTTAMTIDTSQNVGIGTTSPTQKLDVNGTAKATTVQATTLSDGTNSTSATNAIQGSAKAWASFDGVGSITNLVSYNVSSITRNSTGDYTINFTNALASSGYSIIGMAGNSNQAQATNVSVKYGTGQQNGNTTPTLKSTTQCTFVLGIGNSTTYYDSYGISIAVFR